MPETLDRNIDENFHLVETERVLKEPNSDQKWEKYCRCKALHVQRVHVCTCVLLLILDAEIMLRPISSSRVTSIDKIGDFESVEISLLSSSNWFMDVLGHRILNISTNGAFSKKKAICIKMAK